MRYPRAALIALISLTVVAGCGRAGSSDGGYEPHQPGPVQPTEPDNPAPPVPPQPPVVRLPQGSIPAELAGTWNGGQGTYNSSEWLQFSSDGRFQRSTSGTVFEQGVAVMSGNRLAMYLTTGKQRTASVSFVAASGIETLSLTFSDGGTYTYAKA